MNSQQQTATKLDQAGFWSHLGKRLASLDPRHELLVMNVIAAKKQRLIHWKFPRVQASQDDPPICRVHPRALRLNSYPFQRHSLLGCEAAFGFYELDAV